jgi:uncharacterized membrane protein
VSFPIDLDEPFAIFQAQKDLNELVPELLLGNNPPFYFVLLHGWIKLFGLSAFALRSLSLLFGVLTIIPLFQLSKRVLSKEVGIVVVLLYIFSSFNHYHAMEVRMYSLMVLLVVLAINDLQRIIFENENRWLLLAFWNAALLYTHYLSALIIIIELGLIVFFIKSAGRKGIFRLIFAFALSFLLFLPSLIKYFEKVDHFNESGTWVPVPKATELYGNIIRFMNYNISFFVILGLLIVFAIISKKELKERFLANLKNKQLLFVALFFIASYFGMFVFSLLIQPVFLDRYLLFTTPFLYLLVGFAISLVMLKEKKWLVFLFAIPMISSCYYIPHTNRDGDVLANYVKEKETLDTQIIICPPFYDLTFVYHYDIELFHKYKNFETELDEAGINKVYSFEDIRLKSETDRIIYVNANSVFLFPENNVLSGLVENYDWIGEQYFLGSYSVHIFKPRL